MKDQMPRINMIKQQLRTNNITDETVLALFDKVLRDAFVPAEFEHVAYCDTQLELPHHERMMTPLEEASILQALKLQGHERVLVIGTGTGFFTALISHLCQEVCSVDYYADFNEAAKPKLKTFAKDNITLKTGDASLGWVDNAPYDVVVYTGAIEKLSEMQKLQVVPGGRLFAVVGEAPVMRGELHTLSHDKTWQHTVLFETVLPKLISHAKHAEHFAF